MLQKITLIGSLGRDPEMRYTPSGQAVTNLNIATNHQYTSNSGERVKETTWFRVSVWGKSAEACNTYLRKGSMVYVEGRMNQDKDTGNPRVWTAQDGTPRSSFEITAQAVKFLSPKSESAGQSQPTKYGEQVDSMAPPVDDQFPM